LHTALPLHSCATRSQVRDGRIASSGHAGASHRCVSQRTESPTTQSRLESREAIEAAARLHARLFEWMLQHHDRLAGLFAGRPVDWQGLAGTLATEGLRAC
jgi:hypothetical protein